MLSTVPEGETCVRGLTTETGLAYLNRTGDVNRRNCVSTAGAELNGGDVVPTRWSMNRGVKRGFRRGMFGGGHPQRLGLKEDDRLEREGRDRVMTHESGGVCDLNRVEERWEVGIPHMRPEGKHVAGIFDQE